MLIQTVHAVADEPGFQAACDAVDEMPSGVQLAAFFPSKDRSTVTCIWNAESIAALKAFVDPRVGSTATTTYLELDEAKATVPETQEVKASQEAQHPAAGDAIALHALGKQLAAQKKTQEALGVFVANAALHPEEWFVEAGLARGYAAVGDFGQATVHMKLALDRAPAKRRGHVNQLLARLEHQESLN